MEKQDFEKLEKELEKIPSELGLEGFEKLEKELKKFDF